MRRVTILAIILALNTTSATGAAVAGFQGVGISTCAQFAQLYRDDPENIELIYFSWAQGFMSGMNGVLLRNGESGRNLNSMSVESQQRHLRAYCDKHPLAVYIDAVGNLFQELDEVVPPPR
ncbi:MAG: hypothetical protein ACT4OG_07785 [Alphaproteobacteria bacterium]